MRILGIDPGLRVTGFGVIRRDGQRLQYVTSGCVRTRDAGEMAERLRTILEGIAEVIATHRPELVAIDRIRDDPDYGKTHYMLGMCYISQGDNAKAKLHLESFIAVAAADDADAVTAKEMLSYLK